MIDRRAATMPLGLALESGAAIANVRGVPGTLGFLGRRRDTNQPVLVTSYHVAFGGAPPNPAIVSLVNDERTLRWPVGRVAYGREGVVRFEDRDVWIDAAVVELGDSAFDDIEAMPDEARDERVLAIGDHVSKRGASSGETEGVVVDIAFDDRIVVLGRPRVAPGQIVVRSADPRKPFTMPGDSGAALRDARGSVVGLVWGVTARGDGVACPIAPVLSVLHVQLAGVATRDSNARVW